MSVELRHGDALRLLADVPDESVDAVITDPPYSSGGLHRSDRMRSAAPSATTRPPETAGAAAWTDADQAELDLLLWELAGAYPVHRERCADCQQTLNCPPLAAVIQSILDWAQGRALASRANQLRGGQELVEFGARLGLTADDVRGLQAKWHAEEAETVGELEAA